MYYANWKNYCGGNPNNKLNETLTNMTGSINHRNIYRGKNLGTSVTPEQKKAIQSATFEDLFIGDYWVIADMDYFYNCGDTDFTKHHLVIVPNNSLYNATMSDSDETTGGYVGSKMRTENLEQAKTIISEAFGDMVLTHREYLVNAIENGLPSAAGFFDSTVELMSEIMVYGCNISSIANDGTVVIPKNYTVAKQQLALFALNPRAINNRTVIWLRDVVNAHLYALVDYMGFSCHGIGWNSLGVRPVFCIG